MCVDSGCYSDYSIRGFFLVLKDFDPIAELELYLSENPVQREPYKFQEDQFLASILAKGLLLEIEHGTIHLTDYSCASEFEFTPGAVG